MALLAPAFDRVAARLTGARRGRTLRPFRIGPVVIAFALPTFAATAFGQQAWRPEPFVPVPPPVAASYDSPMGPQAPVVRNLSASPRVAQNALPQNRNFGPTRVPDGVGAQAPFTQPVIPSAPSGPVVSPRMPSYGPDMPASAAGRVGLSAAKYVIDRIEANQTLDVQVGRPILLRFRQPPFRDQVADSGIADAIPVDESEYSIVGRVAGSTTINFWFRNAEAPGGEEVLSYLVRVFDDPERSRRLEELLAALEGEINRAFPNSVVRLSYVGSQVVVRGEAKDVEESTQILRIVSRSLPSGEDVDNLPPGDLALVGIDPGAVQAAGGLGGFVQGQTQSGVNAARVNSRIVNLLEVAGVQQIMLKVTVAEVNRSAIRAIGAEVNLTGDSVGFMSLLPNVDIGVPSTGGNFTINRGDFDLAINALKTLNLAKSLAEPNLVTLNGQAANFQVGGQFPVPQITGFTDAGLQGVEFVPFGVQLNFLPVITDRDRVRLQLSATVSTRDEALGTNIGGGGGGGGSQVPGLNSRNFSTTVELRDGETLAIAGLIQNNYGGQSNRVPFLGDVPILGRIFAADSFTYDEQELVVLVTPYLASPTPPGVQLPLPGSDLFEPSDFEYYVLGRIEGCRAEDFRSPVRTDSFKTASFRHLEQCYIIGQPGHSDGRLCPR